MWTEYCQVHGLGLWSSGAPDVIAYLQTIYDRNQSLSSVYQHLSAIAYFHRLRSLASPTLDPMVAMFMRGLKRKSLEDKPGIQRARPLTKGILKALNKYILEAPRTLRQWRTVWRMNLAFMCLLRWDDVCRLKVCKTYALAPASLPKNLLFLPL
jgi:hypothetical protein